MDLFTLQNANGVEAQLTNYGARLVSLKVPDRHGKAADVVLGFDTPEEYETQINPYFGAIVGRYANRIAHGRFSLEGHEYQLATNERGNHLHGGLRGFDKALWEVANDGANALRLALLSTDAEEGYPGDLRVAVTYALSDRNELSVRYEATTDAPTVLNLTNHAYFNLRGDGEGTVLDHEVTLVADAFTPTDALSIPTGEIAPVRGTPFDFTQPTPIGERIDADDEQLRFGIGYDHNWVLRRQGNGLALAAAVHEPRSGRVLEVLTTQPGIQFYTGNYLDGSVRGKRGVPYPKRAAFCLETQHFPDSPNQPSFPSTVLRPGQTYAHETVFRFSAR